MAKNLHTVARRALTPCAVVDGFRFADGWAARDLSGLRHAVATKSASLVAFHRAQYAPWIERVLGDPALARKVARVASRKTIPNEALRAEILAVIDERLGKLWTRLG